MVVSSEFASGKHWCEQLYEEKAGQMLLYGRSLGLSHAEAEDVLQDAFSAFLKLEGKPKSPENYCFRAFRNKALNYKRSLWRRVAREFESGRWFEKNADENEAERAAMKCLQKLPPEQREVIVLKIWSGYTFEEIAAILDISANTVAGRWRYGMEKLRICLRTDYEKLELGGSAVAEFSAAATLS